MQNGPTIDVVDVDDENRHKYRGYDAISGLPNVDILDAHPDKVDELTPEDLYDAYYSLYPEMKEYNNSRKKKQKYDPRIIDKDIYEIGLLKDIEQNFKPGWKFDADINAYRLYTSVPMSKAILDALQSAGYAPDEYKNRRKEILKWIDKAQGNY